MNPETTYMNPCHYACREGGAVLAVVVTFDNDTTQKYQRGRTYRGDHSGEWVSILDANGDEIARVNARRLLSVAMVTR